MTKNENSSGISLISGSFNQTINVLDVIQPIVVTYSGAATGLNIVGPDDEGEISQSGIITLLMHLSQLLELTVVQ